MEEPGDFGPWLRERRKARGLSASEMARRLGMSWSHYSNLENGRVGPPRSYSRLRLIAELLDLPPALVYERAGMLPPEWRELAEAELRERGRPVPARPRRRARR